MRVGVLSQLFPPENAAIPWSVATHLSRAGHQVKVLTGFPSYPTGRVYDGYRQRWRHLERRGSVLVRRVPLYPSHDADAIRRAAHYLSFAATSSAAGRFLADCDVIYVFATPMSAAAAAAAAHALYSTPYVLHVQDLWPESVVESGMIRGRGMRVVARGMINAGLSLLYRRAAHVIAIAPTMKQILVDRGVQERNVSVVLNWADNEGKDVPVPDPAVRARLARPGRTLAVFAGNVGQMQDVETIVRAAALSRDHVSLDVAVVGSGTAVESVRRVAQSSGAENVNFVGEVSPAHMPPIYAASDYQLVTLRDRPVFRATIPSKLGTALLHGCPVITTVAGDVSTMCSDGGFGLSCRPEDPQALADVFRRVCTEGAPARRQRAAAARDYYWTNMSMDASMSKVEAILGTAARGRE